MFVQFIDGLNHVERTIVSLKAIFNNIMVDITGNGNMHALTAEKTYALRVELADFADGSRYALYDNFTVASGTNAYKLSSLGTYSGTAGTTK